MYLWIGLCSLVRPRRVWGTLSTCSQLAAHLPTAVNVAVQACLWEVQCLGQVATEMKLLPHLGVACTRLQVLRSLSDQLRECLHGCH